MQKNHIEVGTRKLRFFAADRPAPRVLAAKLDKTPYLDPDIEAERQDKIRKLGVRHRVDKIQIGLFYRRSPGASRNFSVEWEDSFIENSLAWLSWEYQHKRIRLQIGNPATEQRGSSIIIKFSNIRKLGVDDTSKRKHIAVIYSAWTDSGQVSSLL